MSDKFKIRDRRGNNRFFVDNALLRGGWGARIGPFAIAVYNALAMHVDADEQSGYPSVANIADLTGMSDRQVQRSIARLEGWNIICKEARFTDIDRKEQTSNEYTLLSVDEWIPVTSVSILDDQPIPPGDSQSPPPVTHSHPPGDSQSPKQDTSNKTQSKLGPLAQKLLIICLVKFETMTRKQKQHLAEAIDILTKRGVTESQLTQFDLFWQQSWRKGSPPTLLQVPELWGEFEQWQSTHTNGNGKVTLTAIDQSYKDDPYYKAHGKIKVT